MPAALMLAAVTMAAQPAVAGGNWRRLRRLKRHAGALRVGALRGPIEAALRVELPGQDGRLTPTTAIFSAGGSRPRTSRAGFHALRGQGSWPAGGHVSMAVDPQVPAASKPVIAGGELYLIAYNSRLPVVVYAQGAEVLPARRR